jgi:acetyltransferase-like isoleucine patch superfamily enzyme
MKAIKTLFKGLAILLPWPIKRTVLQRFFGYKISKTARIGYSWVYPKALEMGEKARIDHLTVAVNLDKIVISDYSKIGRGNWITGFATGTKSLYFSHQKERKSELLIGRHCAITKGHHIDCTSRISIGDFSTIAGYRSQLLTHAIDIYEGRQDSHPITIGAYTFVSTDCVILGGAQLPSYSVLGAKSLLNKAHTEEYCLYGGSPAKLIKAIPKDSKYFVRSEGRVV